jgi:succinyl-diaminopimelate desuccinylase
MSQVKQPTQTKAEAKLKYLLEELVKFPTVTGDRLTIKAAFAWVKEQVVHLPLHVAEVEYNGVVSLILTTRPTKQPKILLLGHIDVVPGAPEMFELKEHHGRLSGRGVFDMKYALAMYLQILMDLEGQLGNYDIAVMITSDEEVGGLSGAGMLAPDWSPEVVINPDALADWNIERAAKGLIWLSVESHGAAGHGSRPWGYKNAIVQLMGFLQELRGHFTVEPCHDAEHNHSTMSVGKFTGGQAHNQIADLATAEVDIRIAPGQSPDQIQAAIKEVASHYSGIHCTYRFIELAVTANPDNDYTRLFELLVTKVAGVKPIFTLSHGSSDSRFFCQRAKAVITTGVPGGGAHAIDEWLDAKAFDQMYRVLAEFVAQVGKAS